MDTTGKNILHENKLTEALTSVSIEKDMDDLFVTSFVKEVVKTFKKNWFLGMIGIICGGLVSNTAYYTVKAVKTRNANAYVKDGIDAEYTDAVSKNYVSDRDIDKAAFYINRYNVIGLSRWFSDNGVYSEYKKYKLWVPTTGVYCDTLCTLSYELAETRFNNRLNNTSSLTLADSRVSRLACSSFKNYFNFSMYKNGYHDTRLAGKRPSDTGDDIRNIYAKICGESGDAYKYTTFTSSHNRSDTVESSIYKYYSRNNFKLKIEEIITKDMSTTDTSYKKVYVNKDNIYLKKIYEDQLENFFSAKGSNVELAKLFASTYNYSNIALR